METTLEMTIHQCHWSQLDGYSLPAFPRVVILLIHLLLQSSSQGTAWMESSPLLTKGKKITWHQPKSKRL